MSDTLHIVCRRLKDSHFKSIFSDAMNASRKCKLRRNLLPGVKYFSRKGLLPQCPPDQKLSVISWLENWLKPAFAFASAAALILAIGLGWVLLKQIPTLREEIARERKAREQISDEKFFSDEKLKKLEASNDIREDAREVERDALAVVKAENEKLQAQLKQIAKVKPAAMPAPIKQSQVDPNAPIVLLESQRDAKAESNLLNIPSAAKTATIWIELAPDARFTSYQLQVFDQAKKLVATVNGAKLNSYGALAVNVPTHNLPSAKYLVKAFGQKNGIRELIGEYNLTVQKQ